MKKQDKVTQQDKTTVTAENTPLHLLKSCVGTYLASKDVYALTVQTEVGAISFTRKPMLNGNTHAIGFNADLGNYDDDDDYDDVDGVDGVMSKYWGWLE